MNLSYIFILKFIIFYDNYFPYLIIVWKYASINGISKTVQVQKDYFHEFYDVNRHAI
jgi:hypothetical protein